MFVLESPNEQIALPEDFAVAVAALLLHEFCRVKTYKA